MKLLFCLLWAALAGLSADRAGEDGFAVPLYPGRTFPGEEKVEERSKVAGLRDRAFSQAIRPDLTVYLPPASAKPAGTAIVIAPGGGYTRLAIDKEGHDVARWLAARGVAGIVLKYRLPFAAGARPESWREARGDFAESAKLTAVAIEDAREAMRIVRARAPEWRINPGAIGMMGFSAGGHLAAMMGGEAGAAARPNFLALIYPAVPRTVPVTGQPLPVFMAIADDDPAVRPESLLDYYTALKQAKIPVELHIYNSGGHGYGIRSTGKTSASWPRQFEAWLAERGL